MKVAPLDLRQERSATVFPGYGREEVVAFLGEGAEDYEHGSRDGAANIALVGFLARLLDIPKRQVVIIAGEKSRSKRVKVIGLAAAVLRQRLQLAIDDR